MDSRIHAETRRPGPGEFVLYWVQVTLRARDNFAFNLAVEEANRLRQPVLVYHGLRADYPWASDRIHTFILESAADLASDFADLGVQYEFFLDREGNSRSGDSPLVELALRASLVVTDFFPTFIVPRQTARLRTILQARGSATPVIAVDSSTVVPVAAHGRAYSTARAIRPVLLDALPHHLHPVGTADPGTRRRIEVPFTTPAFSDIGRLVASCPIDHTVAPSTVFRGGTAVARRKLERFLEHGLPHYDERSNPTSDTSSGLSPYLHFGNICPQEILLAAKEAGPEDQYLKFRDQVLTWRELSFNFAYHDPRHREPESIPDWARRELEDHSEDPRPVIYRDEQLERAETGDELWNAAQRQYLETGYMHNYLRMLWGKAVLQWTPDYRAAHRILVHLNNKYSLDGRDPNSYAGIAWIFGKFDRPFYRRPVYGLVRYMSLGAARKKFKLAPDPAKLAARGPHQLVLPELTKHVDR